MEANQIKKTQKSYQEVRFLNEDDNPKNIQSQALKKYSNPQ